MNFEYLQFYSDDATNEYREKSRSPNRQSPRRDEVWQTGFSYMRKDARERGTNEASYGYSVPHTYGNMKANPLYGLHNDKRKKRADEHRDSFSYTKEPSSVTVCVDKRRFCLVAVMIGLILAGILAMASVAIVLAG